MRREGRALIKAAVLFLLIGLLGGCGGLVDYGTGVFGRIFGGVEERSPAELIAYGEECLEKGRYQAAAEAFQQVKDRYPYSRYATVAELRMADALFKRGEYNSAYEAYDEFERLHPRNEHIPYVIYRKGECHMEQVSTIDRDQSHTRKAKEEYERLVKRFPGNDYAKLARKKIRKCLIFLAEYELYVGHFYFERGDYKAAMGRYRYIIENYPDTGQYHEALEYMSRCKERLAEQGGEKEAEEGGA